jgi:MFS family permease
MTNPQRLTPVQWTICVIAAIGFAFDTYELLVMPLVMPPTFKELLNAAPGTPTFNLWRGLILFLPAVFGGIFGLLGGYLTDRLGRRRVLTWSIFLYAFSALAAGFSTSIWMLLFFRCTTFVGVCVEFVAAVAWLAELFPNPAQRERVLGYTQFCSSFGGILAALVYHRIVDRAADLPAITIPNWLSSVGTIRDPHAAWRYALMSGLIPALPLAIVRPFLPESPAWLAKRAAGTLKRPSFGELFAPELRRTTVITTLMMACSFGVAFGAIQQIPQIVPIVPDVRAAMAEKSKGLSDADAKRESGKVKEGATAKISQTQEWGGLTGRLALAILVTAIASQRRLIRTFLLPGLVVLPIVFGYAVHQSQMALQIGIFAVGFFTVAQFSFWGNYLPRVYPLHLRGTGESFAANIGGRMLGTSFALVTSMLALAMPGESDPAKVAAAATVVGSFVYLANIVLSFWLPEPERAELPDEL